MVHPILVGAFLVGLVISLIPKGGDKSDEKSGNRPGGDRSRKSDSDAEQLHRTGGVVLNFFQDGKGGFKSGDSKQNESGDPGSSNGNDLSGESGGDSEEDSSHELNGKAKKKAAKKAAPKKKDEEEE